MTLSAVPPAETASDSHQRILAGLERLSTHRKDVWPISRLLENNPWTAQVGHRMNNCARHLELAVKAAQDGQEVQGILCGNFCKARLCPMCEWRRTVAWRARCLPGFALFRAEFPTHVPLFLTLTVRNCPLDSTAETIDHIHKSWSRLTKRKFFPSAYWLRRTEVTVGNAPGSADAPQQRRRYSLRTADGKLKPLDDRRRVVARRDRDITMPLYAHPHLHALLMVPASYWSIGYITQLRWQQEWMDAAHLDYPPIVDVRRGKAKSGSRRPEDVEADALREVAKYVTKSQDVLAMGKQAVDLHYQLKGKRLIAVSSALQKFIPNEPISAEEMTDLNALRLAEPGMALALVQWEELASTYQLTALT